MCQLETIHIHQPLSPDAIQSVNPPCHCLQTIGVDVIVENNGLCREASMIMEYEKPGPPQVQSNILQICHVFNVLDCRCVSGMFVALLSVHEDGAVTGPSTGLDRSK